MAKDMHVERTTFDLGADKLLTSSELAERWRFTLDHLSNLRARKRGIPWIEIDTGGNRKAIRYRLADVLEAERTGTAGPVNLGRVVSAVASCSDASPEARAAIRRRLEELFG